MRKHVIFGNTSFTERIALYITAEGKDSVIAFTQEKDYISCPEISGLPVLEFERLRELVDCDCELVLGIGYTQMNTLREAIYLKCKKAGFHIATYISTRAIVYSSNIGEGCFICPGAVIGPGCTIGIGNYLEIATVLSHDNEIGNFNFFSTNVVLGGTAKIGSYCFLGLHSTVRNGISINDKTLIGAHANMILSTDYQCNKHSKKKGGGIRRQPREIT